MIKQTIKNPMDPSLVEALKKTNGEAYSSLTKAGGSLCLVVPVEVSEPSCKDSDTYYCMWHFDAKTKSFIYKTCSLTQPVVGEHWKSVGYAGIELDMLEITSGAKMADAIRGYGETDEPKKSVKLIDYVRRGGMAVVTTGAVTQISVLELGRWLTWKWDTKTKKIVFVGNLANKPAGVVITRPRAMVEFAHHAIQSQSISDYYENWPSLEDIWAARDGKPGLAEGELSNILAQADKIIEDNNPIAQAEKVEMTTAGRDGRKLSDDGGVGEAYDYLRKLCKERDIRVILPNAAKQHYDNRKQHLLQSIKDGSFGLNKETARGGYLFPLWNLPHTFGFNPLNVGTSKTEPELSKAADTNKEPEKEMLTIKQRTFIGQQMHPGCLDVEKIFCDSVGGYITDHEDYSTVVLRMPSDAFTDGVDVIYELHGEEVVYKKCSNQISVLTKDILSKEDLLQCLKDRVQQARNKYLEKTNQFMHFVQKDAGDINIPCMNEVMGKAHGFRVRDNETGIYLGMCFWKTNDAKPVLETLWFKREDDGWVFSNGVITHQKPKVMSLMDAINKVAVLYTEAEAKSAESEKVKEDPKPQPHVVNREIKVPQSNNYVSKGKGFYLVNDLVGFEELIDKAHVTEVKSAGLYAVKVSSQSPASFPALVHIHTELNNGAIYIVANSLSL